jgi:hypothetical protein
MIRAHIARAPVRNTYSALMPAAVISGPHFPAFRPAEFGELLRRAAADVEAQLVQLLAHFGLGEDLVEPRRSAAE